MKWVIYILCFIAIITIVVFLNHISEGNILDLGLGDFILQLIGYFGISSVLRKHIWKE